MPLSWNEIKSRALLDSTPEQLAQLELSHGGLHWEALDEDISVAVLLAEQADLTRRASHASA
jgi:hypothetical protein